MKTLASILAGAVLAGLIAFFAFDQMNAFYANGPMVMINMAVFVGFIAAVAILGATLAVTIRAGIRRSDERLLRRFEQRLHALESDDPSLTPPTAPAAPSAPSAPPAPPPEPQA